MNKSLHVVQTFGLYDVEGRTGHVSHLTQSLLKRNHIPEIIAPAYQTNYPKDIEVNQKFTKENIRIIRPGNGLAPKYYNQVLGRKVKKKLEKGTAVKWDYLQ